MQPPSRHIGLAFSLHAGCSDRRLTLVWLATTRAFSAGRCSHPQASRSCPSMTPSSRTADPKRKTRDTRGSPVQTLTLLPVCVHYERCALCSGEPHAEIPRSATRVDTRLLPDAELMLPRRVSRARGPPPCPAANSTFDSTRFDSKVSTCGTRPQRAVPGRLLPLSPPCFELAI
ncbi:hypothetical protein AURDEDRAFT_117435 [Auricularia subglabra TFB-10046 SS5]|uniref:Uncharacterized protein n=1 Tax=Auricularia subglabra (strain TFB-10046 / SS5) TaxID=717982 RepID=J0WSM5_AURST|nr:hypothetical protein AURDEDRAFT_117435 [Auricularia subglabra TFB-10046 SS5]